MMFTPSKNKLSQMRFEGQQPNSPWATHISELGAVYMPVEAGDWTRGNNLTAATQPLQPRDGCELQRVLQMGATKSIPPVASVLLGAGKSVVLCRHKPFGGCRDSSASKEKLSSTVHLFRLHLGSQQGPT